MVGGMLIAPSFQTYFGIDPNDKLREAEINGTIVSVLQVGCLFGALLSTSTAGNLNRLRSCINLTKKKSILDKLGRKFSIMLAAFIFLIGGILQIIGIQLEVMYVGRITSGLGVGALSMLVPVSLSS